MAAEEGTITASTLSCLPPLELSRVTTLMLQIIASVGALAPDPEQHAIGKNQPNPPDPESPNFQSLHFIFNSRPEDLRTKEVIAALCNLLHTRSEKRHRPQQESTHDKPIPVQSLASSLLVSCLCGLRAWPLALIKLYVTDALGARQWVQHSDCAKLVENIQTVWKEIPTVEGEDKEECQEEELEQKQKKHKLQQKEVAVVHQTNLLTRGVPPAQVAAQEQQPPSPGINENSNNGSESSSGDEMEVDIGGGVALSGHQAIPAPPHITLVCGTPLEIDTSVQNTIQHPHPIPQVANRFVELRTKARDVILNSIKARLEGLNAGGRDRESSGGGVAAATTSTVWQVVLALAEMAPMPQARVIAASHLDKWLQSPGLSKDALSLKRAIIAALERYPGSVEEDIAVVRSVCHLHVKVSQLDTHVADIASMSAMRPNFLREAIMGILLGVEGTRKDAGNTAAVPDNHRFQTKAIQAIRMAVGSDELLTFLGRICRELSEEYVAGTTAASGANATVEGSYKNNVSLKCLSLGLSAFRRTGDPSFHPAPLLHGMFYSSNRRPQIQGDGSSVAKMGFLIADMVRRVIMAHAEAEVSQHHSPAPSKISPSSIKMTDKQHSSSHHFHYQQQQQQQQRDNTSTTISVPAKFISSLIPLIGHCSMWCCGDLRKLGASANDCLAILRCMLFLSPSTEYKGGGAIGDAVQQPITSPTTQGSLGSSLGSLVGSTSMGTVNPAQHSDGHRDDLSCHICERFSPITSTSLGAVLSLLDGVSPPPFQFVLSTIYGMVIRAAESSAWLKTPPPVVDPDTHSPLSSQQQPEEMLLPQQPKMRRRSSVSSEAAMLEVQPSPLEEKNVPKDGFVQVDNPDLLVIIFRLAQWTPPPPSRGDIHLPVSCLEPGCDSTLINWTLYQNHMSTRHNFPRSFSFAIRKLYWRCCIICLVLAAGKPQTIGNYVWNNDPTLQYLMKILICNRFDTSPLGDVTVPTAYPEVGSSQSSSSREGMDRHVPQEDGDVAVSMEKIAQEWERREVQFRLDSAYPPSSLTPQAPSVPSPKPLPAKQNRLQERMRGSTSTRKTITVPSQNISQRGRKRKSLFNLAGLMDNDGEYSEPEKDEEQRKDKSRGSKQTMKNPKKSEIIECPEESPEEIEVHKFGLRISDVMVPESRGTTLGLPRIPPIEALQLLRSLDGELGLGARLRQSTQPDFIAAVVENAMPATADSIEKISSWLLPCMVSEPTIISRLPVPIVTHLALMACLEEKKQQTMGKGVMLYEEGSSIDDLDALPVKESGTTSSMFLDNLKLVATLLTQYVSSFVWDASRPNMAAEAATVLVEVIGDISVTRRFAAHHLLNLACFSSPSSSAGSTTCEVTAGLTTNEGGEVPRWLTQISKLPCFSTTMLRTTTVSAFEMALIRENDTAVLHGIMEAFGDRDLGLISQDQLSAFLYQFLARGRVAEKVLLQYPSSLDISSTVIRDSLISNHNTTADLDVTDEAGGPRHHHIVGADDDPWKGHPLGRVFLRFPSSCFCCSTKTMGRGDGSGRAEKERKRKEEELLAQQQQEPVLHSVPLALLKVGMKLLSMWQPHTEVPAIRDLFLMLLPNLEEDRSANIGIAGGVSSCIDSNGDNQKNGKGSSSIQLRDWINLARTRRDDVGRLTALCVPEPLLPQLLMGSGLGTGCTLAALVRLGKLETSHLNDLFHEQKLVSRLLLRIRADLKKIRREELNNKEVSSLISSQTIKDFIIFLESKAADLPRNDQEEEPALLSRKIISLRLPAVTSSSFLPVFRSVAVAMGSKADATMPHAAPSDRDIIWKKIFVRSNHHLASDKQSGDDNECLGKLLQFLISETCSKGSSPAQACRSLLYLRRLSLSVAAASPIISAPCNYNNTGSGAGSTMANTFSWAENALRTAFLAVRHELEEETEDDRGAAVTDILGEFLANGHMFIEDLLYLSEKSKSESIPLRLVCDLLPWVSCETWVKRFLISQSSSLKPGRKKLALAALDRIVMAYTNGGALNGRGASSSKAMKWIRGTGCHLDRKIHLSEAELTAVGHIILGSAGEVSDEEASRARKVLLAYCTGVSAGAAVAVLIRLFVTAAKIDDSNNVEEEQGYDDGHCIQDRSRVMYARQLLLALYMKQPVEFVAATKKLPQQLGLWDLLVKEFASYKQQHGGGGSMGSSCPSYSAKLCRVLSAARALSSASGDRAAAAAAGGGTSSPSLSNSNPWEDQQQPDGSAGFHTRLMCSIAKQYPLCVLFQLKDMTRILMDDAVCVKSYCPAACPNMRPAVAATSGAVGGNNNTPFTKVHVCIWGSTYSDKLWVAVLDMLACCSRGATIAAVANPLVFKDLLELIKVYLMLLSVQLEFGNAGETTACSLARGISEILQWIGQGGEVEPLQVLGWSANELLYEFVPDSTMAIISSG